MRLRVRDCYKGMLVQARRWPEYVCILTRRDHTGWWGKPLSEQAIRDWGVDDGPSTEESQIAITRCEPLDKSVEIEFDWWVETVRLKKRGRKCRKPV